MRISPGVQTRLGPLGLISGEGCSRTTPFSPGHWSPQSAPVCPSPMTPEDSGLAQKSWVYCLCRAQRVAPAHTVKLGLFKHAFELPATLGTLEGSQICSLYPRILFSFPSAYPPIPPPSMHSSIQPSIHCHSSFIFHYPSSTHFSTFLHHPSVHPPLSITHHLSVS